MHLSIAIGEILDAKYRVLKKLGEGGFGEVYLADDELLGRQVAIKMLNARNPADQSGLIHEMQSLYKIQHPNIVGFYHHFVHDRLLFLVMEYCGGGTLRSRMSQQPLTQHLVFELGRALAETLHFVHGKNIVHHDIKPENLLFALDGSLKVGDFGIANRNGGTWLYIAPEMHLGQVDAHDARLDVYALGITILEMLRNENPFEDMSRADMISSKLQHDFIPRGMDRWVEEVVTKATHPSPELRFQTMQEFQEAIEAQHVSYVFERSLVQAHALADKAEKLLARKHPAAASKCIVQALFARPDCVAALVAAGRYNLFINRIDEARNHLDRALKLNPRIHIQKELGWICLEAGNYPQAISLLTDHLQRSASDYEAFNLLLECFYRTEQYDAGIQLAKMMIEEGAPSDCFRNNGILCCLLSGANAQDFLKPSKLRNPILDHNFGDVKQIPEVWKRQLLFQTYRLGLPTLKPNTLTIALGSNPLAYDAPVVSIGREEGNDIHLSDTSVSRRHCVIVNHLDDVWVYDLGSTLGVFVDGARIDGKVYLDGVHVLRLGQTDLVVTSKIGLLV